MRVIFRKSFKKQAAKLQSNEKKKLHRRLRLFEKEPYSERLRNHALYGKWDGFRSIDVGGDVRAVYQQIDEDTALFVTIGTHSELYE